MANGTICKKVRIGGIIHLVSGLHIGGSNMGMAIGGADATVIRNPLNNQPYIPGSSLKGKMRSLLERLEGRISNDGGLAGELIVLDPDHIIARIFGTTPDKIGQYNREAQPVSRLIVRDCPMTADSVRVLGKSPNTDMPYTEVKTEVVIDRITAASTPRQIERVPAGAEFEMELILTVFEGDAESAMLDKVLEGLLLVQNDYLGGKGTRGSGEVRITVSEMRYKDRNIYEGNNSWEPHPFTIPKELRAMS